MRARPDAVEIGPVRFEQLEAVRQLLAACGWTKKVESPELFAKSVLASQIALVAEDRGRVAGFLRAITDGVFNGYISMVAVAPDYRRSGVGSALVAAAVESSADITWVLRADRDGVDGFYRSLGFEKIIGGHGKAAPLVHYTHVALFRPCSKPSAEVAIAERSSAFLSAVSQTAPGDGSRRAASES